MRTAIVTAAAAATLLTLASTSTAAPDRTVTLSREARHASWSTPVSVGPYVGVPALHSLVTRCLEPAFACDQTLVELDDPGDLTVEVTETSGTTPYNGFEMNLYKSDARGSVGATVARDVVYDERGSITGRRLAAGYYLVELAWGEGLSALDASVSLTPSTRRAVSP